jgi:DNA polymerase I-like protein with 3'-5' exonuclease and polymerase domains
MRVFAHYVNDPKMIDAIVKGDKSDGTEIHSLHRRALGELICKSRDVAKTFIYAWLLGAAIPKISEILECSLPDAKKANNGFLELYPGLQELKDKRIPADAHRGYFTGLDGRLVVCPDEHRVLAGYLQNGEKIIMARACLEWHNRLIKEKVPFEFINFVHDEWQTLVPDDDETANYVARCQQEAIENQAQQLGLNLPLAANSNFGYSWAETH